jgi:uncharacterized protein YaaN involved in tellurite resistance
MARITKLTEADLNRLVKKVIKEEESEMKEPLRSYEDYQHEVDAIMDALKQSYHDLMDVGRMAGDDKSLSEEERDEIDWTISAALDNVYGTFLQDWE